MRFGVGIFSMVNLIGVAPKLLWCVVITQHIIPNQTSIVTSASSLKLPDVFTQLPPNKCEWNNNTITSCYKMRHNYLPDTTVQKVNNSNEANAHKHPRLALPRKLPKNPWDVKEQMSAEAAKSERILTAWMLRSLHFPLLPWMRESVKHFKHDPTP